MSGRARRRARFGELRYGAGRNSGTGATWTLRQVEVDCWEEGVGPKEPVGREEGLYHRSHLHVRTRNQLYRQLQDQLQLQLQDQLQPQLQGQRRRRHHPRGPQTIYLDVPDAVKRPCNICCRTTGTCVLTGTSRALSLG